jgi:hypothetical protein
MAFQVEEFLIPTLEEECRGDVRFQQHGVLPSFSQGSDGLIETHVFAEMHWQGPPRSPEDISLDFLLEVR